MQFRRIRSSGNLLVAVSMNTDTKFFQKYEEIQYYRQRWVLLLLLAGSALSWYNLLSKLLPGAETFRNSIPDWTSILFFSVFGIAIPLLIYFTKMITEVDDETIHIRLVPFTQTKISISNISNVDTNPDNIFNEIAFWEFSWGKRNSGIYNICGRTGITLSLKDSSTITIGSETPEKLSKNISKRLS